MSSGQPGPGDEAAAFIHRWSGADGSELANAQTFTIELCTLLGVPKPEPARESAEDNAYVFERAVTFRHGDGSSSAGRIDCYRRGAFVLEAKKVKARPGGATAGTPGGTRRAFDDALLRARAQAEAYARALPAAEGRPPFVVVVDVGLLPKAAGGRGAFVHLLHEHGRDPPTLRSMLAVLWADMDRGGFSPAVAQPLLCFNGKLFKGSGQAHNVLPLDEAQIALLLAAAGANWREVEPAIFGTLLERALDPAERHALGAHYTPRAYVERLVLPTVVEPLRAEWADAQAAPLLLAGEAEAMEPGRMRDETLAAARAELHRFHHRLCTVRVLDPACGSGNFLYVTLEHLKRLEAEVLERLHALVEAQSRLGFAGETVTPQQLLGIEVNERAAALAELVLWIGFLQWHIRSFGDTSVAEPVIHDYGNIEHRDAVLAWDRIEPMLGATGQVVGRWDGTPTRPHPATGEPVPDESAQVPQWRYINPRPAEWPQADFIVGNPPFIGKLKMREALGDGYAEALRSISSAVPDSADFVMYWVDKAASLARAGSAMRFGLISTNGIRQSFDRRVLEQHMAAKPALALAWAVPDHPWVDNAEGAAVRISMIVGRTDSGSPGRLSTVLR
jgi:hypothetical protein